MKQSVPLVVLVGLLSATAVESHARGHASAGGFGHAGASMGRGTGGHRIFHQGAVGFGFGGSGLRIRRSWPLYGWGFGLYSSQYYAPLESGEYDAASNSEGMDSPPPYYYQRPPESNIKPNCQDSAWAGKGSPSSLSNFMNRVFELQCQNRHPDPQAETDSKPGKN